jgi:hypothetical protein
MQIHPFPSGIFALLFYFSFMVQTHFLERSIMLALCKSERRALIQFQYRKHGWKRRFSLNNRSLRPRAVIYRDLFVVKRNVFRADFVNFGYKTGV